MPNFYLMVREFDRIFRQFFSRRAINCTKIEKSSLKSQILQAHMVGYYWDKLVDSAHKNESSCLPVLEYLINLFVNIKGFAVARKEKEKLKSKCKPKAPEKGSVSLRGAVKRK